MILFCSFSAIFERIHATEKRKGNFEKIALTYFAFAPDLLALIMSFFGQPLWIR